MDYSRRQFIAIGGGAAASASAGAGLTTRFWGLDADPVHDPATDGDTVVPTFCEICFWKCGVLAHVKDGTVTKIVGNPAHPLSRGRLCPRGTGGTGLLYDPDRLRRPMIRRGERGEQRFEEVSWEVALDHVAAKMTALKDTYGPEALALFNHGYGASFFKTLLAAYGSPSVGAPSYAQCRGSRDVAFQLTFGAPVGSPEYLDIENTRVLTLIGSHLGENMHNTQVQDLARMIERGGELVVVDPRYSTAAGKARYWLPIKPGTDIALLLAWAHVIVKEGLYDHDFVSQNTVGFEALAAHLADKTPEWAWARTSLAPERIVETARFIAGAGRSSLVHPGRHAAWTGEDTQRGRAIAILNALLGSWGHAGGFFLPAKMKVPAVATPAAPTPARAAPDTAKGEVFPFMDEGLAHGLRDASIPGTAAFDIKGWFVYGTNLLQSLPNPKRTIEALQKLDFIVAIDVLPTAITGWADVILPECTYLERWDDLAVTPWREPFVAVRQQVVPPMYDSRPGWWIAKELARRLGLDAYFPWESAETMVRQRLEAGRYDVAAVLATGVAGGTRAAVTVEEGATPTFGTPSGKVELYSQQMADAGLPPLPDYTEPEPLAPDHFHLLFGRAPTHTFGRTTNNRMLSEIYGENELWVNAQMAMEQGWKAGDPVVLVNQDGERCAPIRVKPTQRIRPDCVYMVHGYGHTNPNLRYANGRGADDTQLVSRVRIDPAMGGTGMNVNVVRIERAEA